MKGWVLRRAAIVVVAACGVTAQAPPAEIQPTHPAALSANPLLAEVRQAAERVGDNLLKTAEKMPEDQYGFQVVPDIPTFAGTIGHAIDVRMRTCAAISGSGHDLKAANMAAKAALVAAMRSSIAECAQAFAGLTDASAVRMFLGDRGEPQSRLSSLYGMVVRDSEVYGSLALHLRLRGIEPPSTERGWLR